MRTRRSTLIGGPSDGFHCHISISLGILNVDGEIYKITDEADSENRRIFRHVPNRVLDLPMQSMADFA